MRHYFYAYFQFEFLQNQLFISILLVSYSNHVPRVTVITQPNFNIDAPQVLHLRSYFVWLFNKLCLLRVTWTEITTAVTIVISFCCIFLDILLPLFCLIFSIFFARLKHDHRYDNTPICKLYSILASFLFFYFLNTWSIDNWAISILVVTTSIVSSCTLDVFVIISRKYSFVVTIPLFKIYF